MMRRSHKQMFDIIFFPCSATDCSAAATALLTVFSSRSSFDITKMRNRNHHIFFLDQVFDPYFIIQVSDLCFSCITEFFFYLPAVLF